MSTGYLARFETIFGNRDWNVVASSFSGQAVDWEVKTNGGVLVKIIKCDYINRHLVGVLPNGFIGVFNWDFEGVSHWNGAQSPEDNLDMSTLVAVVKTYEKVELP